ncbi:O-methyltransferase [Maribacter sp. 2-571]|uniref:O-methyltransferase n=1 Tax=Maribacter sp. 2-571 TaxID=3417569 RepID=UPI003D34F1E1
MKTTENTIGKEESGHRAVTPHTILGEKLMLLRRQLSEGGQASDVLNLVDECLGLIVPMEGYLKLNTTPASDELMRLEENTNTLNWESAFDTSLTALPLEKEMLSGALEGQFLKMLVEISGAKNILEIGSFTGYASLAMAEGLPENGKLYACEYDRYTANFAREQILASNHAHKIEIVQGDALESMNDLKKKGETFDFVFLDADKKGYAQYYSALMDGELIQKGGILCIDNTLYMGETFSSTEITENGRAIKSFNAMVAADERVRQVMLPLRDGVTIVRRVG